ncbi:OmpW family protein [Paeniroseomonas aquatica]|uniref:OmpW family outer membrane protein n=1 Tax=Paeniroseomonas aquatica TaxID=373043 RepID=A0ABT8A3Y5_9PROT|nr:OmpW family outer membrane protein [Paeniroseomonas aquatica]MDN3564487.1 OmpW family outer membrane protein [Paeniroseomonas aquatica]
MRKTLSKLAGALALAAAIATPAAAQVGSDVVRGKQAGDLVLGLGAIGVLPSNGGRVDLIGGKPEASNSASPQLDLSYFVTPQIALNLIAATTRHDVSVKGSALGNLDLGHVWVLPPTLTLQFHPFPAARFSPYVGAGLNVSFFYGEGGRRTEPVNRLVVDTAVGFALNLGADYEIAPNWLVNADLKKLFLRPDASVNSGLVHARVDLDPWIIGASVRYRF